MRREYDIDPTLPTEKTYFRGIEELLETEQFQSMIKDEFPEDAPEWLDPVSRRQFVSLMGASLALAGVVGCNPSFKPASGRKQLPYVKKPDAVIPGVSQFYASTISLSGVATGVVVKALEGRPLKVEGNAKHPTSLGSTDIYTQGSLLNLYDPDRSKSVKLNSQDTTWEKARQAITAAWQSHTSKQAKGSFAVLSENTSSPTLIALIDEAVKAVGGKWVSYEPASPVNVWEGTKLAFGKAVTPVYQLDTAKVILAVDWDVHTAPVCYSKQLTKKRKVRLSKESKDKGQAFSQSDMNRIYAVESMVTGTGVLCDHRLPLKPTELESFIRYVAEKAGVANGPKPGTLSDSAKKFGDAVANDLLSKKGEAIVLAGNHLPPSVHALVASLNAELKAVGKAVNYIDPVIKNANDQVAALKELTAEMAEGKVETLIILGTNPVFTAPTDINFASALDKVKNVFHLGQYVDETAAAIKKGWHINEANALETWGDGRGHDGTLSLQQPICAPVHGGKSAIELFGIILAKKEQSPLDLVKAQWKLGYDAAKNGEFDLWFNKILEAGVLETSAAKPVEVTAKLDWVKDAPLLKDNGIEITFLPDPTIYDGRFANNGWLQECPKPVTKITWDCAIICSPKTLTDVFKSEMPKFHYTGGENGRMEVEIIKVTVNGKTIEAPVFLLPGHADGCVTLHYGFGRTHGGRVANTETKYNELLMIDQQARMPVNAFALQTSTTTNSAGNLTSERTTKKYIIACTQGQHGMEGRRPARHGTVEQIAKNIADKKSGYDPESKEASRKLPFAFANNPFASAAERDEIVNKLPGSPQELHLIEHGHDAHGHDDHAHDDKHPKGHDSRVIQLSLIPDKNKGDYRRWAMAIDLGACTGCSACVVACVAENNIPVIGKTEVSRGRAMHWIRIDRYFAVTAEKGGTEKMRPDARLDALNDVAGTSVHVQPVGCQQCEKAPCEVVCPVGATVHSADGLNDMAYNRCVGTRYCSNNCPYKVRRFNFIQYADYQSDSMRLVNNPEVSVRQRGVMEKCTYCTQRIRNAEIETEREWDTKGLDGKPVRPKDTTGRPHIRDGEILTACQQVCPAGAISFGDISDPTSEVRAWKQEPTNYGLLAEFNTMPRTTYLAAVKNPNPDLSSNAKGAS